MVCIGIIQGNLTPKISENFQEKQPYEFVQREKKEKGKSKGFVNWIHYDLEKS